MSGVCTRICTRISSLPCPGGERARASIRLSIQPSIHPSVQPFNPLSFHFSIHPIPPSLPQSLHPSFHPSISSSTPPSLHLTILPSISSFLHPLQPLHPHLSILPSIPPPLHSSFHPSISPSSLPCISLFFPPFLHPSLDPSISPSPLILPSPPPSPILPPLHSPTHHPSLPAHPAASPALPVPPRTIPRVPHPHLASPGADAGAFPSRSVITAGDRVPLTGSAGDTRVRVCKRACACAPSSLGWLAGGTPLLHPPGSGSGPIPPLHSPLIFPVVSRGWGGGRAGSGPFADGDFGGDYSPFSSWWDFLLQPKEDGHKAWHELRETGLEVRAARENPLQHKAGAGVGADAGVGGGDCSTRTGTGTGTGTAATPSRIPHHGAALYNGGGAGPAPGLPVRWPPLRPRLPVARQRMVVGVTLPRPTDAAPSALPVWGGGCGGGEVMCCVPPQHGRASPGG